MAAKRAGISQKSTAKRAIDSKSTGAADLTYEEQIIIALRRIIRAGDIHSHLLQREFGVTGPQLATLRVIRRLQPVSAGDLANATYLGFATMSGILDRLVARGHITRTRDPEDRRSVILRLTRSGEQLLKTAPTILQPRLSEGILKMRAAERNVFLKSLQTAADLMQSEAHDSDEITA